MFKKILAIGGVLAIATSLSVIAVAGAAEATHPAVIGTPACDSSGQSYITWRVSGDTTYAGETATIVAATLNPADASSETDSLIGQSVMGSGYVEADQTAAISGIGYTLTVGVQWTNHPKGDFVTQTSDVVTAASCVAPPLEDATAALTKTAATCDVAAELVLGQEINFTWGTPVITGSTYSVIATADAGHTFAAAPGVSTDGSTMEFSGSLDPKKTDCAPTPNCIPSSAVSYTYDGPSNTGSIRVENVPSATGELCKGFWVTATSWKYKTDHIWPQTLDQVDYVNGKQKITTPGDYPFQAVMTCGQGDVYASFDEQPEPGPILTGPNTPYVEHFLHEMGFAGPNPTWFGQPTGCNLVTPVKPSITTATECGIAPTVTANPTANIDYVVKLDAKTGDYVVTATPQANYYFSYDDDQVITFTGNVGVLIDCVEKVNVSVAYGTCSPEGFDDGLSSDGLSSDLTSAAASLPSMRTATLTFDNSESTKPVLFQVVGFPEHDTTVPAGKVVDVEIVNSTATGSSYTVTASGRTFVLPIPSCQLPPLALVTPTYSVTQPTCTSDGSYTLGSVVGDIVWTVNGTTGVASGTYPAPANRADVTITAAPAVAGDGLDPDWVNPVVLTFAAPSTACSFDPPTLAFVTPALAYTGLTIGGGLSLAGGLLFVGFAGLMVARRRTLQGE